MLVLKVFQGHGHPRIIKVEEFPYTIGRSLLSQFILDHPSVSANHAIIDLDEKGNVFIQDCESRNGIYFNGKRIDKLGLEDNQIVYLGEIKVEIFYMNGELEETREINIPLEVLHGEASWKKAIILPLLSFSAIILPELIEIYFTDPIVEGELTQFFSQLLGVMAISILVSCVFSVISKIHLKKYQFFNHLVTVNILIGVASLLSTFMPFILFNINSIPIETFIKKVVGGIFFLACPLILLKSIFKKLQNKTIWLNLLGFVFLGVLGKHFFDTYYAKNNAYDFLGVIVQPFKHYSQKSHPPRNFLIKLDEMERTLVKDQKKRFQKIVKKVKKKGPK